MTVFDEAYFDIIKETIKAFNYIQYTVISNEPEEDAINHVRNWANYLCISYDQIRMVGSER